MTATEINGVKVVGTEPVLTALSYRLVHQGRDSAYRTGAVAFTKVTRLILADGDRSWIGCTFEGCDYAMQELPGNHNPARKIIRGHYTPVHAPERTSPRRTKRELEQNLIAGTDVEAIREALKARDIPELAKLFERQIEVIHAQQAHIKDLKTKVESRERQIRRLRAS